MTDREAFEAWWKQDAYAGDMLATHEANIARAAWQAALASERAKQSAATNVGIDWANPATLNGVLCHAAPDCDCTMAERMSGHKLECPLGPPEVDPMDAAPPAVQAKPVGIIHEWKGSRWLVVPICPPGGKLPKIGDRLYAAPPADDEAVRLLRELRDNIVHNSSLRDEYQEWNDSIEAINAYLARVKC